MRVFCICRKKTEREGFAKSETKTETEVVAQVEMKGNAKTLTELKRLKLQKLLKINLVRVNATT